MSDDTETNRIRDGSEEILNRLRQPGDEQFSSEMDYLGRYETGDEDGNRDTDPEQIAVTGLNRILFSLDQLGSEQGRKPVYVHLLTGVTELFIAFTGDRDRSED